MIDSISDKEIELARIVLGDHTVKPLSHESTLESLLWCIASQALGWEAASSFIYCLRDASHSGDEQARFKVSQRKTLSDKDVVFRASQKARLRFAKGRRFDSAIDYFISQEGAWWERVISSGQAERARYVDEVKWLGEKTFSFWHICLGGTHLMALDVHVMRGLRELDIDIDPTYINSVARSTDAQKVRRTPPRTDYWRIESEARELFAKDKRFAIPYGTNMALADAVLWWRGAHRGEPAQSQLFGDSTSWKMPYSCGLGC